MSSCHATPVSPKSTARPLPGRGPEPVAPDTRTQTATTSNLHPGFRRAQQHSAKVTPHPGTESAQDTKFDLLDRFVTEFVRTVPGSPQAADETEQFVAWLSKHKEIDPEQRDILICLFSRHAMEAVALQKRLAQARFAEFLEQTTEHLPQLTARSRWLVRLNPVHVWAKFQTHVLLGKNSSVPACVLFYQVGNDVRTAVLTPQVAPLIRALESASIRVGALLQPLSNEQQLEMLSVLQHLAKLQIIAIA